MEVTVIRSDRKTLGIEIRPDGTLLVTGGGAFNTYAMDLLRAATPYHVVIPDADTVN